MKKVLLLTDYSSGYSRTLLKGIIRYSKCYGPWIFYRMPLHYRELHSDEGVIRWAKEWQADVIIAQLRDFNTELLLRETNIPVILQNYRKRFPGVYNITGDYYQAGCMAAEFYLKRNYQHFAFYGTTETIWGMERMNGFRDTLSTHGFRVHLFTDVELPHRDQWRFDPELLCRWLLTLPKPIAFFACSDTFALHVTQTCNLYSIKVPNEIAILGVDNDELSCHISNPPLSSIELDVENGGFEVGRLAHQLMEKIPVPHHDIVIRPLHIQLRESTEEFFTDDKHITTVLNYIRHNYTSEITVEKILELVPLSRRVLEKRFKAITRNSIYHYVLATRVNRMAYLLTETNKSLNEIAHLCGFPNAVNIARTFTKFRNETPSRYRARISRLRG